MIKHISRIGSRRNKRVEYQMEFNNTIMTDDKMIFSNLNLINIIMLSI